MLQHSRLSGVTLITLRAIQGYAKTYYTHPIWATITQQAIYTGLLGLNRIMVVIATRLFELIKSI